MSNFDLKIKEKFAEVERERSDLHPYQRDLAIPFLMNNPFSGLFIDMGLGKTISSGTVIADLLAEFDNDDKVLVVGPLRVATETWPTEFRTWRHTAWMNYEVIHVMDKMADEPELAAQQSGWRPAGRRNGLMGKELEKFVRQQETAARNKLREKRARSSASVHIISRDWVEWLVEFYGPRWPYRTVIIDESSGFKDWKSGRFKALAKIRNSKTLITRLHILTATPAAETYMHLFAQIYLVDAGERFGRYSSKFLKDYFDQNRWSLKWTLRPGAEQAILEKISDICLVMKAEDYSDVKEPITLVRKIHLNAREMGLYETLQKDFVVKLDDGTVIEAESTAILSAKLLQLASGVLYETVEQTVELDDDTEIKRVTKVHHIHDYKIEELKQIVDELQGKPILVGYHFKSSLDRLKKAFPKAVVMDRDGKAVKQWNAGKIAMLLMHPQSGGHGLNLQKGGHHIAFFDLPWSLELYLQFIGRLARQGQLHQVFVHVLMAVGTVDELVFSRLRDKFDAQDALFSLLKRLIRKFRKKKEAQHG